MIIISSVQFSNQERDVNKFSDLINHTDESSSYDFYTNYTTYRSLSYLTYKFDFTDFYIRKDKPNILDLTITIWIVGKKFYILGFVLICILNF
jgi:hypothetical protein